MLTPFQQTFLSFFVGQPCGRRGCHLESRERKANEGTIEAISMGPSAREYGSQREGEDNGGITYAAIVIERENEHESEIGADLCKARENSFFFTLND